MTTTATTSREIRGPEQDGSSARPGSPSSGAQQRQENPGDLTGATFGKASSGALGNFLKGMKSRFEKLLSKTETVARDHFETVDGPQAVVAQIVRPSIEAQIKTAKEMVESYAFDKNTGVSTFTVPAGVTDVEAMKALNDYFRVNHSGFNRDAVNATTLEWFEKLPKEYPTYCQERDYSQARQITITGIVRDTGWRQGRIRQEGILNNESLVFSDPRDQALAAAIHACKYNGEDLFREKGSVSCVRSSVPGFALFTQADVGVNVSRYDRDDDWYFTGASGSPSPEVKKA